MNRDASIEGFLPVGSVIRAQGLNGEVRTTFDTDNPDAVRELTLVYLRNDRGDMIPARITNLRTEEKGNNITFFVQFEHIADRTAAEALRNRTIWLETRNAEALTFIEEQSERDSLIDYEVFDENGDYAGVVTDIMEHPAQSTLIVATTSGTLMIPCVDYYIAEIDDQDQSIYCNNLSDLEDL